MLKSAPTAVTSAHGAHRGGPAYCRILCSYTDFLPVGGDLVFAAQIYRQDRRTKKFAKHTEKGMSKTSR